MEMNLAIIPARGGSKRLPRKNIAEVNGKPIVAYTIEHALNSGLFDKVVVSTDDEEIADVSQKYGAEIPFIRPKDLAEDTSTVSDVCTHLIDYYSEKNISFENFCCLYPTSPLRDSEDIKNCYSLLKAKKANFSTGVTRYHYSPFQAMTPNEDGFLEMIWPEIGLLQSQYQPQVVVDNGSMYWVTISAYKIYKDFYGPKHIGYEMSWDKSIDINTKEDLTILRKIIEDASR